jgi:hypothetical protein
LAVTLLKVIHAGENDAIRQRLIHARHSCFLFVVFKTKRDNIIAKGR